MSNSWPTLSRAASVEGYSIEPSDPTVRSATADGRPLARAGTGPILNTFRFTLRHLSAADKVLLDTLQEDTVGIGGETFTWTESISGSSYTVRLAHPLIFTLETRRATWRTDVTLFEEPGY